MPKRTPHISLFNLASSSFALVSIFSFLFQGKPELASTIPAIDSSIVYGEQGGVPVIQPQYHTLVTETSFTTLEEYEKEILEYPTEYEYTDELYLGEEVIVVSGEHGKAQYKYQVYYWQGEEVERELLEVETTAAITQIIKVGTRKLIRDLATELGTLQYYQVREMWATSYDGNCLGCSGVTYTGTDVHYGVCAVDPNIIPLGSYIYIPGYGKCHAEDIGGAIKGDRIDLGFADVKQGWWSSRSSPVYLLEE